MKKIKNYIKKHGLNLEQMGVKNFALNIKDSLEFLDKLESNNIIIYGGDVIRKKDNHLEYTYENWSYDGNNSIESIEIAKKFIQNLKFEKNSNIYIEFVTDIDLFSDDHTDGH